MYQRGRGWRRVYLHAVKVCCILTHMNINNVGLKILLVIGLILVACLSANAQTGPGPGEAGGYWDCWIRNQCLDCPFPYVVRCCGWCEFGGGCCESTCTAQDAKNLYKYTQPNYYPGKRGTNLTVQGALVARAGVYKDVLDPIIIFPPPARTTKANSKLELSKWDEKQTVMTTASNGDPWPVCPPFCSRDSRDKK